MTEGERIAQAAIRWLGTPHVNGAKAEGHGIDCGMLLIASLEGAGLVNKDEIKIKPYSNMWQLSHSEEWFLGYVQAYCDKIPEAYLEPGDFLLYQFGRCISHGGVYVGNNTICHACVEQGVILSSLDDTMLYDAHGKSRLRGVYRFSEKKREEVREHGFIQRPDDNHAGQQNQ